MLIWEEAGEAWALYPHFSWIIFHVVHKLENIFSSWILVPLQSHSKVHWNTPLWVIFYWTLKIFFKALEKKRGEQLQQFYVSQAPPTTRYIDHWQIIAWQGNKGVIRSELCLNLSQTCIRTLTVVSLFCLRSLLAVVKCAIISTTMRKRIQILIAKQVSLGAGYRPKPGT